MLGERITNGFYIQHSFSFNSLLVYCSYHLFNYVQILLCLCAFFAHALSKDKSHGYYKWGGMSLNVSEIFKNVFCWRDINTSLPYKLCISWCMQWVNVLLYSCIIENLSLLNSYFNFALKASPDMAVTLLEIARIFATKVPGKVDADVLQLLWKVSLPWQYFFF